MEGEGIELRRSEVCRWVAFFLFLRLPFIRLSTREGEGPTHRNPEQHASLKGAASKMSMWRRADTALFNAPSPEEEGGPFRSNTPKTCSYYALWEKSYQPPSLLWPRVPVHCFGPSPTAPRAHVWPRPGGSCQCTNNQGIYYPDLCAGNPLGLTRFSKALESSTTTSRR